ncbi:C25 family cysteine peptidase [Ekhidna sp. To15]|uniref:putative type IX secretion system sortase PorU2 n=1 Tax=Ekhidna sp. To15 TaxID=3395267 RepID=UPI003F523501
MWRNKIIGLLMVIATSTFGQVGNEWIDFTQTYYKIKIAEDGFYRVTQDELSAIGFPIGSVPATRVQLFRRGQEVAINVNANGDGTLNYFEFYGIRNDGESDAALYDDGDQPHTFYNLFSDTATYFLTYKLGSENGKRMAFSSDRNASGLTPEAYHLKDTIQLFTSDYSPGRRFGTQSAFSLSKYDEGEGWTGSFQGKNAFRDFDFTLEGFETSAANPVLETVIIGGNSLSHNAAIEIGQNTSSLGLLGNVEFGGWGYESFSGTFNDTQVGAAGEFVVRITAEGFSETSERISVAYVRIQYPQTIQLGVSENKIFTVDNPSDAKAWLQIPTTNASGTRIFDITDPFNAIRISTTNFSSRVEAVIPDVSDGHKILAVTNPLTAGSIEAVDLPNYNLSNKDYLIVSHADLRSSGDPVRDYKNHRESVSGGGYAVQIANIDDLYNLYNYGDPSPMAIRNFIIDANNQNPVENVFIIGKGFTTNFNYYRGAQSDVNVPTYGVPGSDLPYTLGIDSDSEVPGIAIGRLNAFDTDDVTAYLNKVIEMEALPYDDLFRKDFLQLSGGINQSEISNFIQIVQDFTEVLETDFIGGRAFNTGKETGEAVEFVDVTDRVNQGVGYITFFGHSSGTVTDIEIGRVSDPSFGFANKGKYPVFLVNGCKAGEIFGTNFTFGEDWLSTPDLGAVGFIAHSDVAISTTLRRWSDLFYELGFGDDVFIGETIGNVMLEVSERYIDSYGTSDLNLTQVQQMTLQGDPAYRVFGADSPDYQIDNNSLSASAINAQEILASQDSFRIDVIVKNFGRTIQDSLIVQINRTYPDGAQQTYTKEFSRPLRQDTLAFYIPNDPVQNNDGLNLFNVILDPTNTVDELDKTNNSGILEVSIFSGNTINLYPLDNATLANDQVEFVWQSSNLLEDERSYQLELDTQPDFAGPNNRQFTVPAEVVGNQSFDFAAFSLPDSSTIYWRTRYANAEPDETNEWVQSTFTLINNVEDGWGQYDPEQVENEVVSGVQYNQLTNEWEFIENSTPIDIFTFGIDNPTFSYEDMEAIIGGLDFFVTSNTIDPNCETNTFNAIAFDKESGDPYRPIVTTEIDVFNREVCGRLPQRIYQFREEDMIGVERRFQVLVDNMRDGDMIVMFNIGNVDYSNWDAGVESTLNSLGVSTGTINSLTGGQPVIFFGRKGDTPGAATTIINNGSATPVTEQSIDFQDDVVGKFVSGELRSRRIGPAKSWEAFSYNITEEINDNIGIEVLGVDKDGNLSTLESRGRAETIDIASVDPVLYPQIELSFSFDDETDQTPAQLNFWQLNYEYPAEGIVLPESKSVATFLEGEEIVKSFYFYNISEVDFTDSLSVMTTLINHNSGTVSESSFKIAPPLAGDTTVFETAFSSFNMGGSNSLVVEVLANENEVYQLNNRITQTDIINVQADETNPVLDVTFDGYHILDGDIVSPNPNIIVKMRDDNPFASKTDTTGINLSLKLPGEESQFQRISFSDPRLTYTPASTSEDFQIEYQPGPLDDGVHAIRIQAEDESGNEAGTEPYEINFEVINESTITHFYPYPNPFSTRCRFVFTLTGTEIPDQIKIQILTVSGRVVREITQDEIGPIRIGNNITSFAWDGRDEFGDQLANGVYFYKVFINSNGNAMQQRSTSADRAFKNGFGKLYILR